MAKKWGPPKQPPGIRNKNGNENEYRKQETSTNNQSTNQLNLKTKSMKNKIIKKNYLSNIKPKLTSDTFYLEKKLNK